MCTPYSSPEIVIRVLVVLDSTLVFGRERSNVQVFKSLRDYGCESLFVIDTTRGCKELKSFLGKHQITFTNINLAGLFSNGMSLRQWLTKIWYLFKGSVQFVLLARRFKPTHIHISSSTDFVSIWLGLALLQIPVIYRLGDAPLNHHVMYRWIWKYLIKPRVSTFVCISNYIKNCLNSIDGFSKERVIYNYPPKRTSKICNEIALKQYGLLNIIYIGQVVPQKGVALFVEAACKLCGIYPNIRFIIAGAFDQDSRYLESLVRFISEAGYTHRFEFTGYVDDIYTILMDCDIHVIPSIYQEPLGNVVVEAKSVGVPSVVFPTGGTPELIEHGIDGFICSEVSAEALKDGIEFFLQNEEILTRARMAAKNSMLRLGITQEQFTKSWCEVYGLKNNN